MGRWHFQKRAVLDAFLYKRWSFHRNRRVTIIVPQARWHWEGALRFFIISRWDELLKLRCDMWMFPKIAGFPPNHPFQWGFSIIYHPFLGYPYFWGTSMWISGFLLLLGRTFLLFLGLGSGHVFFWSKWPADVWRNPTPDKYSACCISLDGTLVDSGKLEKTEDWPSEDVFPIEDGNLLLLCWFTGG